MFVPKRIIFEKGALEYEMANEIFQFFKDRDNIEIIHLQSNRVNENIPGRESIPTWYKEGKKTLVVGIKKSLKFQSCKPSAHYQLPLVSGCMGQCEYCYLNTMLGDKPYLKVHVNVDEILNQAKTHMIERKPDITIFEGSATSDPVPVEPYTKSLEHAILFFGEEEQGRFRFVTKYNDIESLLALDHNEHTEIRFSINTDTVIKNFENATASRNKRIEASVKAMVAGYPVGFLVAPVFIYPNWKEEYHDLLIALKEKLPSDLKFPLTFEVISHRYTSVAKNRILEFFPDTKVPMENEDRKFKYGQFGYGKYVYKAENMEEIKRFFKNEIDSIFTNKDLKYII